MFRNLDHFWSLAVWAVSAWILLVDVPMLNRSVTGYLLALPFPMQALLQVGRCWPLALSGLAILLCYRPWREWLNVFGNLFALGALLAVMFTFHTGQGNIGN